MEIDAAICKKFKLLFDRFFAKRRKSLEKTKRKIELTERTGSLNPGKATAVASCPIIVHFITYRALSCMTRAVRSKDARTQLTRT